MADFLTHAQSDTVQSLTIASIGAAAVTSIVSGSVDGQAANWTVNGFAIGGGVVTAGL